MMRIACIDNSAADRINLQNLLDTSYQACRSSIGHLVTAKTYPATRQEVLLSEAPDAIAIGPRLPLEEAYTTCRTIREAFNAVPILVFLEPQQYCLRTLRRFEKFCTEVFTTDESPIRVVHKLSLLAAEKNCKSQGKLVAIVGAKGGIGATTLTAALAHAAESAGSTAVVVDLSRYGVLLQYLQTPRWQSAEFATTLLEAQHPDDKLLDRCLTTAPNGIQAVLPPAGGSDIRELWIRDASRFELTLTLFDLLRERFDLVLIDLANAEGVLPFALLSRADEIILLTSNDPASVHLLNSRLSEVAEIPGRANLQLCFNMLDASGLQYEDIIDFLYTNEAFSEDMAKLPALSFDPRGNRWIGTGNTLYTEGNSHTRRVCQKIVSSLQPEKSTNQFGEDFEPEQSKGWKLLRGFLPSPRTGIAESSESTTQLTPESTKQAPQYSSWLGLPRGSDSDLTRPYYFANETSQELFTPPKRVANGKAQL